MLSKDKRWALGGIRQDLINVVERFQCSSRDEHLTEGQEGIVPPLACTYCHAKGQEHILCTSDEDGMIVLYNTDKTGETAFIKEWEGHNNAIFDVKWSHDGRHIVSTSGDQTAVMWDVTTGQKLDTFKGHTSSVKSVSFSYGSNDVFITGSRDGHIMVWDKRITRKDGFLNPVNVIKRAHFSKTTNSTPKQRRRSHLLPALDSTQSVTAVISLDEHSLLSSGAVDGIIKVWDLRKNYRNLKMEAVPRFEFTYAGNSVKKIGFSSLCFDSSHTQLFANCTDDTIYQFDCATYISQPVNTYTGHQNSTFFVRSTVSLDNLFLISGSSDHNAYIWQIGKPLANGIILKGHTGEVTSVDWSSNDIGKVITLSDDNTTRIWRLKSTESSFNPNEVVGTAERIRKEIGVSTNIGSGSISTLNQPQSNKKPCFLNDTPKLRNASLKKWFSPKVNSNLLTNYKPKSPRNMPFVSSPRKLIINSPLKMHGIKRKLDKSNSPKSAKRLCPETCKENREYNQISPNTSTSPRKVLSEVSQVVPARLTDTLPRNVFQTSIKLDTKGIDIDSSRTICTDSIVASTMESPTYNLPNIVLSGSISSTHKEIVEKPPKKSGLDWLTKLCQKKKNASEQKDTCSIDKDGVTRRYSLSDTTRPIQSLSPLVMSTVKSKSITLFFKPS